MLSRPQYDSDPSGEEDVRGNDEQAAHEKRTAVNKMTVKIFFTLFPFDSPIVIHAKSTKGNCPLYPFVAKNPWDRQAGGVCQRVSRVCNEYGSKIVHQCSITGAITNHKVQISN
jgi:hypothetical protein